MNINLENGSKVDTHDENYNIHLEINGSFYLMTIKAIHMIEDDVSHIIWK